MASILELVKENPFDATVTITAVAAFLVSIAALIYAKRSARGRQISGCCRSVESAFEGLLLREKNGDVVD